METHKSTRPSSERKKWGTIFNSMVRMLQTRQAQLETLVKERKILEDVVKMQHDRWVADTRLYENTISQMKGDMLVQEMERSFDASKFNFVMGLKDRDAHLIRLKNELTEGELEDFKAFFDILCEKYSALSDNHSKNSSEPSKSTEEGQGQGSDKKSSKSTKVDDKKRLKVLENEIRMLRQAYEKLKSEKDSEVSALVTEKKFVWNQYNIMEEDYTSKLRSKNSDIERATSTIKKLLGDLENLQNSNHEKDDSISTLKSDKNKLKEETCRLSNELESLRKSKTPSTTPVLNRCNSNDQNYSSVEGKSNHLMMKKDASSAEIINSKKGSRGSSKRKRNEVIDTPKLFSSSIKIPKLKSTFYRL